MKQSEFDERRQQLFRDYEELVTRPNVPTEETNGVLQRWEYPVLTGDHAPPFWRYDLNPATNPHLMERIGVHSAFNPGAIEFNGKCFLMARVEGADILVMALAERPPTAPKLECPGAESSNSSHQ